jgi:hypothetical protein
LAGRGAAIARAAKKNATAQESFIVGIRKDGSLYDREVVVFLVLFFG